MTEEQATEFIQHQTEQLQFLQKFETYGGAVLAVCLVLLGGGFDMCGLCVVEGDKGVSVVGVLMICAYVIAFAYVVFFTGGKVEK